MVTAAEGTAAMSVASASASERVGAGIVSAASLALLMIGASLRPNPIGHGTHLQLGLPQCGWLMTTGHPCPTCGMTTAFSCVCNGEIGRAFLTQPGGAMVAIGVATAFWLFAYIALTGSRLGKPLGTLLRPRVIWIVGAGWMASWVYTLITWKTQ